MIEPRWVILGLLAPALIAAAAMACVLVPRRRAPSAQSAAIAWSLALAAGWLMAYGATGDMPREPWNTGENWLLPLGLAAPLVGLLPPTPMLQLTLRLALLGMICFVMMLPAILWEWRWYETLAWVSGATLLTWGITHVTDTLARRNPGRDIPLAMAITAAAAGMATLMTDSQLVGQFGLALAAVILGAAVAAFWLPRHLATTGVVAITMPLIVTVLLFGTHSSDLHLRYALTVLATPTLMWIGELPPFRGRPPWQIAAIRLTALLVPLTIMFAIVTPRFLQELRDSGY